MKAQYQSSPRSTRVMAAAFAIVTAVALFDFVAGLGESTMPHVGEAGVAASAAQPIIAQAPSSRATPSAQ